MADLALLATVPDQDPSLLASLAAAQSLASCCLVGSAGRTPSKESVDFGSLGAGHALSSPGPYLLEGEHQPACRERQFQTCTGLWEPAVVPSYLHGLAPVPLIFDKNILENSIAKAIELHDRPTVLFNVWPSCAKIASARII